ncbi:MAG: hypothetical protein AAGI50_08335 [Pseudomonadota bacterium]
MRGGALLVVVLLAGCTTPEIPAQRPEDFGGPSNRTIAPVENGAFVVGGGPGRGAWCAAGRYAEGTLGIAREARLSLVGAISSEGLTFGGAGGEQRVDGPGVLYTVGPPGAFAFISSAVAEDRTVSGALADCA